MVNQFKTGAYNCATTATGGCYCMYQSSLQDQCQIEASAVLKEYSYPLNRQGEWVGIMIAIIVVYRLLAWVATWARKK